MARPPQETVPSNISQNMQNTRPIGMDLFAFRLSQQFQVYMSWRLDSFYKAVDALQQSWKHMFCHAFPPFSLITRVLQKIQEPKVAMNLITPSWWFQPRYWWLLKMSVRNKFIWPNWNFLLKTLQSHIHLLIKTRALRLAAWMISSNKWKQKEYLNMQESSQILEEHVQKLVTNWPGISECSQKRIVSF